MASARCNTFGLHTMVLGAKDVDDLHSPSDAFFPDQLFDSRKRRGVRGFAFTKSVRGRSVTCALTPLLIWCRTPCASSRIVRD